MQRREAGFTFIEILVVMSIIVVLAGMVMVGVPYVRERGRQTESLNNVRGLALLLSDQAQSRRTWAPYSGKGFVMSLVATNAVDARNKNNLRVFFSPGDTKYVFDAVAPERFKEITPQALRNGMDVREFTSYAGRRNGPGDDEFKITPDKESMNVPIVCDDDDGNLHHPKGLIMAFTDGGARFVEWDQLEMPPPEEIDGNVDPFLGDDATSEELRAMSSQ